MSQILGKKINDNNDKKYQINFFYFLSGAIQLNEFFITKRRNVLNGGRSITCKRTNETSWS